MRNFYSVTWFLRSWFDIAEAGKLPTVIGSTGSSGRAAELLELIEVPRTEFGTPFSLDVAEDIEDLCIGSMPALGIPHNSRTALFR